MQHKDNEPLTHGIIMEQEEPNHNSMSQKITTRNLIPVRKMSMLGITLTLRQFSKTLAA